MSSTSFIYAVIILLDLTKAAFTPAQHVARPRNNFVDGNKQHVVGNKQHVASSNMLRATCCRATGNEQLVAGNKQLVARNLLPRTTCCAGINAALVKSSKIITAYMNDVELIQLKGH